MSVAAPVVRRFMHPVSMDGYVAVVAPYLDPRFVGRDALTRIRQVAALLPPCSLAGLELRLRDDRPSVDFFVRLPYTGIEFSPALLAHPVWRAVQRVCGEMSDPAGPLREQARFLFLEFDLDADPPPVPVPSLFFELHAGRPFTASDLLAIAARAAWEPAVSPDLEATLAGLSPEARARSARGAARDALARCLAALPPGANVAHTAVMPSRPGHAQRIVIDGMPVAAVTTYLADLGWRDPSGTFAGLVSDLASVADPVVMLDLDVADDVLPKVGVEFYVRRETDNAPRWRALLDLLVERDLAGATKAQALLAWPGFTQETPSNPDWAPNLLLGDLLLRGRARSMFWRTLNHVKLAYEPGRAPEIKAYLGFGHNWFPEPSQARP